MQKPRVTLFALGISFSFIGVGTALSHRDAQGSTWNELPLGQIGTNCSIVNPLVPDGGFPCPVRMQPKLEPRLPDDLECINQQSADCLAWQQFISLNWPASASARGQPDLNATGRVFGRPGGPGAFPATVWQTYKLNTEVFLTSATQPPSWETWPTTPSCAPPVQEDAGVRVISRFTPDDALQPALHGHSRLTWLADTSSNLVWYEVRINETEFQYIIDAGLYNATNQWTLSQPGRSGVKPPAGSIEIKAAWREISDSSEYRRYLMTEACLPTPGGGSRWARLGLVGLHILSKLGDQPQWLWSTFEQVDNAPTVSEPPDGGIDRDGGHSYSFYNPDCDPSPIPAKCLPLDAGVVPSGKVLRSCDGQEPAYALDAYFDGGSTLCAPYPTQVVRRNALPRDYSNPIVGVNEAAQGLIRNTNPDSVFQYYQLINAMWWTLPAPNAMDGGAKAPLSTAQLNPTVNVANTVLETYHQDTNCLTCHVNAAVSNVEEGGRRCGDKGQELCAADFSFVFDDAKLARAADAGPRK